MLDCPCIVYPFPSYLVIVINFFYLKQVTKPTKIKRKFIAKKKHRCIGKNRLIDV